MTRAIKLILALLATGSVIASCGGGQRSADPIEQVPETGGLREKLRAAAKPGASDFPAVTGRSLQELADRVGGAGPQAALASSVFTVGENAWRSA